MKVAELKRKSVDRRMRNGRRKPVNAVLGSDAFAAISAVEGIKLNAESESRLRRLLKSNLSPDQKRAEIIRAYAAKSSVR